MTVQPPPPPGSEPPAPPSAVQPGGYPPGAYPPGAIAGWSNVPPPASSGKNRVAAILLALFLGSFGIHRMYLGNVALGVVYLVFFWTGIPGLIAWVESLVFLTRSDADWAAQYGGPVERTSGPVLGCLWLLALLPLLSIGLIALIFLGSQVSYVRR